MGNTGSMQSLSIEEMQSSLPNCINHQNYEHQLRSIPPAIGQSSKDILKVLPEVICKEKPLRSTNNGVILQAGGTISGRKLNNAKVLRTESNTSIKDEIRSSNGIYNSSFDSCAPSQAKLDKNNLRSNVMQQRSRTQIDILPSDRLKQRKFNSDDNDFGTSNKVSGHNLNCNNSSQQFKYRNNKLYDSEPDLIDIELKKNIINISPKIATVTTATNKSVETTGNGRKYSHKSNEFYKTSLNSNYINSSSTDNVNMKATKDNISKLRLFRTRIESCKNQHYASAMTSNKDKSSAIANSNYANFNKTCLTQSISNEFQQSQMAKQINKKVASSSKFSLFRREKSFDITLLRNQRETIPDIHDSIKTFITPNAEGINSRYKKELELTTQSSALGMIPNSVDTTPKKTPLSQTNNEKKTTGRRTNITSSTCYIPPVIIRNYTKAARAPETSPQDFKKQPVRQLRSTISNIKTRIPISTDRVHQMQSPAEKQNQYQQTTQVQSNYDSHASSDKISNLNNKKHTVAEPVPSQLQPKTFFFGMEQSESDPSTANTETPENNRNIDEDQLKVIDLFAKSLLNLNQIQESLHNPSECATSSVGDIDDSGNSALDSFINNEAPSMSSQLNQQQILLKLRPTLPRKQYDIPRFSPSVAWKLLETIDISHISNETNNSSFAPPNTGSNITKSYTRPLSGETENASEISITNDIKIELVNFHEYDEESAPNLKNDISYKNNFDDDTDALSSPMNNDIDVNNNSVMKDKALVVKQNVIDITKTSKDSHHKSNFFNDTSQIDLDDIDGVDENDDDLDAGVVMSENYCTNNNITAHGHTFSLSLPRERHSADLKMQLNPFNSLQKNHNNVNGKRNGTEYYASDSNWLLSYSAHNPMNSLTNMMELCNTSSNMNETDFCGSRNPSLMRNLTNGRHKMYLPISDRDINNDGVPEKKQLTNETDMNDLPDKSLSVHMNHNDKNPKDGVLSIKSSRFTFQSTIRKIERRRLAERLSKEAEEKEAQRLSELEAMRKVEEEFKQKRAREKANLRQQLRLVSLNNNWSSNIERDDHGYEKSIQNLNDIHEDENIDTDKYCINVNNIDDYVDIRTPYISRIIQQKSSKYNVL